jgi:hypothetical protein
MENTIMMVPLERNTYLYGYDFDSKGVPQSVVLEDTFKRMNGVHPITHERFHYLGYKEFPTDVRNGYKVYKLRKNGKSIYEVKEPTNSTSSTSSTSSISSTSSAAAVEANEDVGFYDIPLSLVASVERAHWVDVASSIVMGQPVCTPEMYELKREIDWLNTEIEKQEALLPRGGHSHGGITPYDASFTMIRALKIRLQEVQTALDLMAAHQATLFHEGGGRAGVLRACFGGGGSSRRNTRRRRSRATRRR